MGGEKMSDNKVIPTAILFWGTRGGPVRQIKNLMLIADSIDQDFHWMISRNIRGLNSEATQAIEHIVETSLPKSKIGIVLNFFKKTLVINETIRYVQENKIERVFFLLPHPWDISLAKRLKKHSNVEIWRGVHDLERHHGDFWPFKRTIEKILKFADVHVAFSSHVASQLRNSEQRVVETTIYEPLEMTNSKAAAGSVLFVGRIRKYKGLELLKRAWPLVNFPSKTLTIAGEGTGIPLFKGESVKILNKWLSDFEIENLVNSHRLVILPYVEASQSGIIPLANSKGVPVVVTPIGGLPSQVIHGETGIISKSMTAYDLAEAIDSALSMEWNVQPENGACLKNFLLVLNEFD